ncbi:MAG TPA: transglycosylase domain-containing protein [Candidatus Limnocylindrales bacterium]
MQTTLARRQRHRRSLNRRPTGRSGTVIRSILIAIPVVFVLVTAMLAGAGALFTVAAYNFYAQGLPDPQNTLNNLKFDQQTIVYDRTGKVELARLGTLRREVIGFKAIPAEMLDATTAVEDQGFWTNPGFDPSAIVSAGLDTLAGRPRGASTITQQLVRARLLPPEAFADSTYERKIREIIQSIRLTDAYPGDKGKQDIITAYLNQNFYGNQTYGVKAAAKGYFGKQLDELSLAQYAILAAIPQSPTRFDLMRNAEEVCLDANPPDPESDEVCQKSQLQVPGTSEIVQRRNYILDLMKTRSPLSGSKHTAEEYETAKDEVVVIKPQASANWRAAQFVWQVRDGLATILCPDDPADCEEVDTGGYRVTTTLDWSMQKIAEKWTYVAARAPHSSNPRRILRQNKIPASEWGWILGLRGRNIHNAASAVMDYRTGEVLAYVGSARATGKGNRKFQPQFDVLAKGWRQPGSSIKPIDYAIGIDDETYTAATMFMDVVTDFGRGFTPTQADKKERGPVRLRSALQFSLNIPAIKSTLIQGLDHTFERSQDFGLAFPASATPVTSMGIGTLETHPIDMLTAYATIANGGVRMPRQMITKVVDENGKIVWPIDETKPEGVEVISPQAAYIITDILAGNTVMSVNKYWGEWAITTKSGRRRPAAYKTGTTSDNRDVHAYGYLAPPANKKQPALAVGVWMGNSNNAPNNGSLSLDSSAPLWSAILSEVSNKLPVAGFKAPGGLVTAQVDAFTGLRPGPFTKKTVKELFIKGTVPRQRETLRVSRDIDEASGLLWRDGCAGPKVTRGFFNLNEVESNFPNWQKANRGWAARAAKGPGTRGGPEGTRTSYFYDGSFMPFGKTWGAPFAPTQKCPIAPKETPPPTVSCDPALPPEACIPPTEPTKPGNGKPPKPP